MNDDELSRYSRQILLSEVDYDGQLKLTQSHAVIVGLGGLGSPVSLYLAAAGVGTLSLIDFDNVDDSNLQRQIVHRENNIGMAKVRSAEENLKALNHFVDIFAYDYNLSEQEFEAIIEKADVVIDCTDNFSTRFMLNRLCYAQKKPLISGAAIRWEGQLSTFDFRKDTSPCYQCLYKEDSGQELTCSENGVLAPVVGMVGSIQAIEAIKALLDKPTLTGKLMILDAYTMNIRTLNLKKDPHCPICSSN
ncbi:molybdopterin-synthase adenylyltransferase [Hydrogenovibrio marinus]|uniref:Molybdopterin-synthase adenylyltransferase n=1 Tax=Hydrogenovibrio marinus TaxID=28885 RepID=A0A066ZPJ8_HYDMR|nr:molybdopterin-synthase adenylyltransferase [Hydrogenovibrio marinus]